LEKRVVVLGRSPTSFKPQTKTFFFTPPPPPPDPIISPSIIFQPLGSDGGLPTTANVGVYCNPGWGPYAESATTNYPQPGFAVWQSDSVSGTDQVLISRNDRMYRPPGARDPSTPEYAAYTPYFICAVINQDATRSVAYRLEVDIVKSGNATLKPPQQAALGSLFRKCCPASPPQGAGRAAPTSCAAWKALNAAAGGAVVTDFCGVTGQICSPAGDLLRLDLRGANLQCSLPADELASLPGLVTVNLGRNPGLTGRAADLFDALTGARGLKHLNMYRCSGLAGSPLGGAAGAAAAGGAGGAGAGEYAPSSPARSSGMLGGRRLRQAGVMADEPAGAGRPAASSAPPGAPTRTGTAAATPPSSPAAKKTVTSIPGGGTTATAPVAARAPKNAGGVCGLVANGLTALDVDGAGLTGTLPPCLTAPGSELVELHVGNNALTGPLPAVAATSPLEALTAYNNALTGALPASLAGAPALVSLDLSNNRIAGAIPPSLGSNGVLKYAVLKANRLTGAIPAALATAPNLETLDVKNNSLSRLPAEWVDGWAGAANSSLVNVRFSFNEVEGPFPAGLAPAPALTFLVVNNNSLSGELPAAPDGLFPALRALNASNNRLSGAIPAAWGTSGIFTQKPLRFADGETMAHVFDLSANAFEGPVPAFLAAPAVPASAARGVFLARNPGLEVTCNADYSYIDDVCGPAARRAAAKAAGGKKAPVVVDAASEKDPFSLVEAAGQEAPPRSRKAPLPVAAVAGIVAGSILAAVAAVTAGVAIARRRGQGKAAFDSGAAGGGGAGAGAGAGPSTTTSVRNAIAPKTSRFERFEDAPGGVEMAGRGGV